MKDIMIVTSDSQTLNLAWLINIDKCFATRVRNSVYRTGTKLLVRSHPF
jgi:hypothetical protein